MNSKVETGGSRLDSLKLAFVVLLLAGGVGAFYYFSDQVLALRVGGLLILVLICALVAYQTEVGRQAWSFVQESRGEVRKVVWPTRQETFQTTMLVVAMVIVVALILWGLDAVLSWGVKLLVERGG